MAGHSKQTPERTAWNEVRQTAIRLHPDLGYLDGKLDVCRALSELLAELEQYRAASDRSGDTQQT